MKLEHFKFEEKELRVYLVDSEIWFCATDLTKALGFKNSGAAIAQHCKPKGVVKRHTLTAGGEQELTYLDESNMYRLVLGSKLKEAERFQDWIVSDVLPSIRKTGQYSSKPMSQLDFMQAQLDMMRQQDMRISSVEEKVRQIEHKSISSTVDYYAICGYAAYIGKSVDVKQAAELGRKAANICKTLGYVTGELPDPRFGKVKTYPVDVLVTVFTEKNL